MGSEFGVGVGSWRQWWWRRRARKQSKNANKAKENETTWVKAAKRKCSTMEMVSDEGGSREEKLFNLGFTTTMAE